jgi:hypothetical protein
MSYTINRLIKEHDLQGNPETFLELTINDDLGAYAYGHWLNSAEQNMFVNDESTINNIAEILLEAAHAQRIIDIASEQEAFI